METTADIPFCTAINAVMSGRISVSPVGLFDSALYKDSEVAVLNQTGSDSNSDPLSLSH